MKIANKTVLITGANRGIGQALVNEALRRGAQRVYAGTRGSIENADKRVTPITLDDTKDAQIEQAAREVAAERIVAAHLANLGGRHMALWQEVAAQTIGDLPASIRSFFFLAAAIRAQHQWMRHFHLGRMGKQVIVDPAGEYSGFHCHGPRLRYCLHPGIEFASGRPHFAFAVDVTAGVLDAIANCLLVNVQANVIHIRWEPPWSYSEPTLRLSSVSVRREFLQT
jgi:hypothetical protein